MRLIYSILLVSVLVCLAFGSAGSASWVQTSQEDFLRGTLSSVDAWTSPGALSIVESLHRRSFTTAGDFEENIHHNVRVREGDIILLKYGTKIKTYSVDSTPALKGSRRIGYVWPDPTNGDLYVTIGSGGLVLFYADDTSVVYRRTGVYDVTEDSDGVLITSNVKVRLGSFGAGHVWKDLETGDIYLCTDNGGLNIIHTQNTIDHSDDVVEIWTVGTKPMALLRWDPQVSWKDEEGNVYLGYGHDSGFTIVYSDSMSVSYTDQGVWDHSTSGYIKRLIRSTPRIGASTFKPLVAIYGWAKPLLKDKDGDLYVATDNGLTVLHKTDDDRYYDTSVTYRTTGLWDTMEDNVGTLIDPSLKISEDRIKYAWLDDNGDVYVQPAGNAPGSVIHPDGTVTTPALVGMHRWKDENGDIYVSLGGQGLSILHPDGTSTDYNSKTVPPIEMAMKSWIYDGNLYVVGLRSIDIYAPNTRGSSTSGVMDTREIPAHSIRWESNTPSGSDITLQTRTGSLDAFWKEEFEGGTLPIVERGFDRAFDVRVSEGVLSISGFSRDAYPLIHTGKPAGFFPEGSVVRARLRVVSDSEITSVYAFVDEETPGKKEGFRAVERTNEWANLMYIPSKAFSKIGFSLPSIPRVKQLEIDRISVESSEGWRGWMDGGNPYGSIIPNLDGDHPYLQWRAIFATEDPANVLPALEEVSIVSGYLPTGTYISPAFDTEGSSVYHDITYNADILEGTSLRFQIRTAPTKEELEGAVWLGPTEDEEHYVSSGMSINPLHNGDRWIQYRAIFGTQEETKTPVLKEVGIVYEVPTGVEEGGSSGVPRAASLDQNYPNPFNASTVISYELPRQEEVELSIYNAMGQKIRSLVYGRREAGRYSVAWDGTDDNGHKIRSGVYLCRLWTKEHTFTRKMILIQ